MIHTVFGLTFKFQYNNTLLFYLQK